MDTFQWIINYWEKLNDSTLLSSNDIRRNISYWARDEQLEYLRWKVQELSEEIGRTHEGYMNLTEKDTNILTKKVFVYMAGLKKREKLLGGLTFSLRLMEYPEIVKGNGITPEAIAQARNYPISEIVEVNSRGFAHCVNHFPDRHPSMYCKGNWAHCFSCGFSGDSISVYQKVNNIGFVESVEGLSGVSGLSPERKKVSSKGKHTFGHKKTQQKTKLGRERIVWKLIEGEK